MGDPLQKREEFKTGNLEGLGHRHIYVVGGSFFFLSLFFKRHSNDWLLIERKAVNRAGMLRAKNGFLQII